MKNNRRQNILLTTLFPLGPVCLLAVSYAIFGWAYWQWEVNGREAEDVMWAALFFSPIASLFVLVALSLAVLRLRPKDLSRLVVLFPLIGIMVYLAASSLFFGYYVDEPYGFLSNLTISLLVYIIPGPFEFLRGNSTEDFGQPLNLGEFLGLVLGPLIVTTLFGMLVVLASNRLRSPASKEPAPDAANRGNAARFQN